MKTLSILILILIGSITFAAESDYAPKENNRIHLYKVNSENENAPIYSGYYKDSEGNIHRVALWSGTSDDFLAGSVDRIK